jgi:hypothetical protein
MPKPAKVYMLSATPAWKKDEYGRVLASIRFTASDGTAAREFYYPLPEGDSSTVIGLLVSGDEKGIRANQALNRGESIDCGKHDAEEIAEILGFEGLEGQPHP